MRNLDIKNFPLANKKIEEFRKCNVKNITELEFKENSFKDVQDFNFDFLKLEGFNTLFFANEKIKEQNLIDDISLKENKITINKECKNSILILNYYEDENTVFEKDLKYSVKSNSDILIFEIFISKNKKNFISQKRDFEIANSSKVEYIYLQKLSLDDFLDIKFEPAIKEDSKLKFFNFNFGSSNAYNQFDINLDYANSNFDMEALTNISKKQEIANIVATIHNGKDTSSSIKANHILDENAHAIFEVKTRVNHEANNSAVIQNSKTTLLGDDAIINANPRLEIFIDELTASHGATTGSLDEDILYYLQSRGLSRKQASKMMLEAIENAILAKISNEEIRNIIKEI
ncbi:MAG: SufD family Fe-S cluster assembly protein [Arcobacter sp.]|uniref:SufD family Fe-S cluster assembly protein n=1 Tax=Arcobacter sp. TaxID=1872629 RepID=UPI003AFF98A0